MIVVVGLAALVIVAVPGLVPIGVHVPVPAPAIVALPPGNTAHVTVWSAPALGLAVTTMAAVSLQPPLDHMKLYVPATEKVVIVVVALAGVVIVAVPGLETIGVQVPTPVPAIVAVPPGRAAQLTV